MKSEQQQAEHKAGVAASQLLRKIEKAQKDFRIFEQGDSILVGISGGKDSLSLLRLLVLRNLYAPQKTRLYPVHISGNYTGVPETLPEELIEWVRQQGPELIVRPMIIAPDESLPMNCDRCSRNRKHTLFVAAKELGCNKIALGHTMDDFAETALMNILTQGKLEAMKVTSSYFDDQFKLIRPMVYLPGKRIRSFVKLSGFPVIESNCPLATNSHRAKTRELLKQLKSDFPDAMVNLFNAARSSFL